ncbi:MAK10-like protein [Tanacetum coccineum]
MGDENHIRTLGDYSKPSHEGYRNTIELPRKEHVVFLFDLTHTVSDNRLLIPGLRTVKLRNDILMFQQHHGESLSEAWTRFKDLLQKSLIMHRPLGSKRTSPSMIMKMNVPGIIAKTSQANRIALRVPSKQNHYPCEICSSPHDTQYCMENPEQAFVTYASSFVPMKQEETDHIFGLADGTKSYPVGIVKDVEVYIGRLKLLNDFYVLNMKKDPDTPLLVGRGFLATDNAVIDCRMAKIAVGEGITRSVFGVKGKELGKEEAPYWTTLGKREWEISRDAELNPFKDTLVFRRMVEFLGCIHINLKCNMWESDDLIKKPINWNKPPKNGDGAWHAKIRLIDPDGEEFTKTLQSILTTRKLSERESTREIIDLDQFYDTLYLMRRSLEVLRKFHWVILGG